MGVQAYSLTQANENYIMNHAIKGKRSKLVNKIIEYYRFTDITKFDEYQSLLDRVLELEAKLRADKALNESPTPPLRHRIWSWIIRN